MPINVSSQFDLSAQLPIRKYMTVADITSRNAIPTINRYEGFECYVLSEQKNYQLRGGITDGYWAESGGASVSLGVANQIPFMSGTTDFQYSDNFKWNDTTLTINSGSNNNFIGIDAGKYILNGSENVMIGNYAGYYNTNGYANTFIGYETGFGNISGNTNTFIGYRAGYSNITGLGNVFIGVYSGYSETGSNKLYIENSSSATPLIYGDFDSDILKVNGLFSIKLYSQDAEPTLSTDNYMALWKDTNDSDKIYLVYRRGTGDQVKLLFT